ncbi:MAG TPA: hypothetical protein VH817_19785 [Thermoleophilaceae bacterium]|jgi:hypothetical protein
MRKLWVLILAVTAFGLTAIAAAPASADTITPVCNGTVCSSDWYTSSVALTWTFDPDPPDEKSADCDPQTINESATSAGTTVTCTATWGADDPVDQPVTIKVDETNPSVDDATPDASANGAGWFNSPLSWDFSGSDLLSGIGLCSQNVPYSGPDSATAHVSGSCLDVAGNSSGTVQHNFKYDATDPSTTASSFSRAANANGWYNAPLTVNFTGTDATSGVPNPCDSTPYSGPDGSALHVSGECTDAAGNTDPSPLSSAAFNYDATDPVNTAGTPDRAPNANGWYKAPVTFTYSADDDTSGIASCDQKTYNGPDDGSASVSGHCTDKAGNVGPDVVKALKYDATKPVVDSGTATASPDGTNSWYQTAPTYNFSGHDDTSGIDSCPSVTYAGAPSATASVTGVCTDNAGNTSTGLLKSFKFDNVKPDTTAATFSRAADKGTWYNHAVTVNFNGTDATSGVPTPCVATPYSAPDGAGVHVSAACTDNAGNTDASPLNSANFDFDATKPVSSAPTPDRAADVAGWYNHDVTFTAQATDATSGVDTASCQKKTYSGPSGSALTVSAHCSDKAGNVGDDVASAAFNFDKVPPLTPTGSPDHAANAAGWFNSPVTVTFSSTDPAGGSGMGTCSAPTYSGPPTVSGTVSGVCHDVAGNTSPTGSFPLKYDADVPTTTGATPARPANANGWFNSSITFTITGTDATSGIASCTTTPAYTTPDSATASVSGTCTDKAGNTSTPRNVQFKFDGTPPTTDGAAVGRAPDSGTWYNHPLPVTFTGTDNLSGFAGGGSSCRTVNYSGPPGTGVKVTAGCVDQAGNTDATPLDSPTFNYDATPPTVATAAASRPPDSNGWYNHPVSFTFQGADANSGIASCSAAAVYGGPDSAAAKVAGSCQDQAGNTGSGTHSLLYDQTPPKVLGALPDRLPDHDGWFNHPVRLAFQGTDATSGIASCSRYTFSGGARVSGTCTDAAGNSTAASFAIKYDATPPAPATVNVTPQNGSALLTWTKPADAVEVQVMRARAAKASARKAIYTGTGTKFVDKHVRNGTSYIYTVSTLDRAGNAAPTTVSVTPTALSLRPLPGAVVSGPPKLTWKKVRHAHYYNLQLFAGNTKVLSTWPKTTSYRIKDNWLFNGRPYTLVAGVQYRWYVWPGIGPRSKNRYGHLLGKSTFTLTG